MFARRAASSPKQGVEGVETPLLKKMTLLMETVSGNVCNALVSLSLLHRMSHLGGGNVNHTQAT